MTNDNHKSDSTQVAVRLPSNLLAAVKEAASAERRKPAALIRIFIEDAIRGRSATAA
jgi:predicted DNA binding CopG/RHH family protein